MNENDSAVAIVAEWSKGIRLLLAVVIVVLLYYSVRLLLLVPPSEKIFEDMLGDVTKLPAETRFVLQNWQTLLAAMVGMDVVGLVAIFSLRRPFQVCCVAAAVLFIGVIHFHFLTSSLLSPLGEVIKGLSGGV